jgi:hypothetical protein
MATVLERPVIIFGNTRSGTTVVQDLLAEHPGLVGWYEPRNVWQYADPTRPHDEFDASDATRRVTRYVRKRFLDYQQEHDGRRVVEKTPVNILRIPYVRTIFPDAAFVYIVRSPFSFISSVERKWQRTVTVRGAARRLASTPVTQLHHYGAHYVRQQWEKRVLRRRYLSAWGPRYRGITEDLQREDLLTVIARQWTIGSRRAATHLADLDEGRLLRLRYEDLVEDPLLHLERLAAHCGIDVTGSMAAAARDGVDRGRQDKWRRFPPTALASLLPELEPEMARHGYTVPEEISAARPLLLSDTSDVEAGA